MSEVDEQSKLGQEIDSDDGFRHVGNDEPPLERLSQSKVETEGPDAIRTYGSLVCCKHIVRRLLGSAFNTRTRKYAQARSGVD